MYLKYLCEDEMRDMIETFVCRWDETLSSKIPIEHSQQTLLFGAFKLPDIKISYVKTKKTNQKKSEVSIDDVCQLDIQGPDQYHDPQSSQSSIQIRNNGLITRSFSFVNILSLEVDEICLHKSYKGAEAAS